MERNQVADKQSMSSTPRQRCILYAAGPGDVIGTYWHWKAGQDDPSEVSRTYSSQFFDVCREMGWRGHVITTRPERNRLEDGDFVIEDRPVSGVKSGGFGYHVGQIAYGIRLTWTALRCRADAAVVSTGTHWFVLSLMALAGIQVIPALHCALWPAGRGPRGCFGQLISKLDGWFWRHFAAATICVSPECERQVRGIAKEPRGPMVQVRAQYRHQYLDVIPAPQWPEKGQFHVLFAGRIERNKGVFDLLEIAKRLEAQCPSRFTWSLCGSGSASAELATAVSAVGLGSCFALRGKLGREEMAGAFAQAHAVIVPTTGDFAEGLNKVCIESILAGRPVVTSVHSNALDVLGAAAIEVPSGEVDAYAAALLQLAENREAYERAAEACKVVASQFYDANNSWGTALQTILNRFP